MEKGRGRICVTGATGFIASSIIKTLLEDGYSVNATIRSHPEHKKDVSFLLNLPGASENLQIFNADLNNPESFDAAIEGCFGVFHVATPVDFELKEPEEIVTKRSIDGAIGILKASLNSNTVKRVVYTSAIAAVLFNGKDYEVLDESFWSDVDFVRVSKPFGWSYAISKTLTEKAVLEFGEQNGLDVVTVVLPCVVGPFICPKLPHSIAFSLALLFGDRNQHGLLFRTPLVHVHDVTRAYIFLLEHPNPKGRYNVSSGVITLEEIHEFLSVKCPENQIPSLELLKEIEGYKLPNLSSKKLIDAGFEFMHGIQEIFDDAIQCCKEKDYL